MTTSNGDRSKVQGFREERLLRSKAKTCRNPEEITRESIDARSTR